MADLEDVLSCIDCAVISHPKSGLIPNVEAMSSCWCMLAWRSDVLQMQVHHCEIQRSACSPLRPAPHLKPLLCRFKVEMALFSARPRIGGLTVFTSGSASRLFMLDELCANWVGPLAVAMLQPILAPNASRSDEAEGLPRGTDVFLCLCLSLGHRLSVVSHTVWQVVMSNRPARHCVHVLR